MAVAAMVLLLLLALPSPAASQVLALDPREDLVYQGACVPRPRVNVQSEKIGEKDFRVTITAGQGNLELLRFGNSPNTRIDLPVPSPQSGGGLVPPFDFKPPAVRSYTFIIHSTGVGAPVTQPITVFDGCGSNFPWNTFVGAGQSATQVQASIADASITEGNSGTTNLAFTVTLGSPASVPVAIQYTTADGTATAPADYTTTANTLTFAPGEMAKPITVPIVGDVVAEVTETFTVRLTGATGATITDATATGTIVDNEGAPSLAIDDVALAEGNSATTAFTFTVSLTGPSALPISVQYATANDTATAGADYTAASGTVNFVPGDVSETVVVQVTGETLFEANERFFVNLSNPSNATIAKAQGNGTITNDDTPPTVNVSITPSPFSENGGTTSVTATLSNPSSLPVTVDVAFGGSATAPPTANHDFTFTGPAQITVPATQLTGALVLTAVNDAFFEGDEIVQATISNPVNATLGATTQASATLTENETAPTVSLSLSSPTFSELNGTTNLIATLTGTVDEPVTVTVAFTGTASNTDYRVGPAPPAPATVDIVIPAFTASAFVTLTGVDDSNSEGDETVIATIQSVTGGGVTDPPPASTVTATITDDDAPKVTLAFDPPLTTSFGENGGTLTVRATLDVTPPVGFPATITLAFAGTAEIGPGVDKDFTVSNGGQITIANGSTSGTVTLTGLNDDIFEGGTPETVVVTIGSLVNAADAPPPESLTATITDDDAEPTITDLTVANSPFSENLGTATVTAHLSHRSTLPVTVNLALTGSATPPGPGQDYTVTPAAITIAALSLTGSTTLTGVVDALSEGNETVTVTTAAIVNATDPAPLETVDATITDDDLPTVTLSLNPPGGTFAEEAGTIQVVATLSNVWTQDVTVNLAYSGQATRQDGVATNPDYSGALQIVIPNGSPSAFITLTGLTDTVFEGNETVVVDIDSVTNGTEATPQQVTTSVIDNDTEPTVTLSDDDLDDVIAENGGTVNVTATLSNPTTQTVTVNFAYTGTAVNPTDYTRNPDPGMSLTINPLATTASVLLTAVPDTTFEGDKTIVVDIASVVNATESGVQTVTITIDEDDPPPTVFLTVVPASPSNISETGGSAAITANLTSTVATATTVTLAINVSSTATDPADYTRTASLDLVIPANTLTSSTTFDITAAGDLLDENDETVVVDIASVTGGIAEGTPNQITVTITDDDDPPTVSWTVADQGTVLESVGALTATAHLSAISGKTVTVPYAIGGTATVGALNDYTIDPADASPLVFSPGTQDIVVNITIIDDTTPDASATETITLTIDPAPTNATRTAPFVHSITIQDNDPDAVDDSYAVTANIEINVPEANGLLDNDILNGATITHINGAAYNTVTHPVLTLPSGANLEVFADGSFNYNPPAGVSGTTAVPEDSFTYTLTSGVSTDTATVNFNISADGNNDVLWFVNENETDPGNGRLTSPFNSLAAFEAANAGGANQPKPGDFIFLYESATSYVGPVTLDAGQNLIGQDASATIQSIYGVTLAAHSVALPGLGGGTDIVNITASTGNAINLPGSAGNATIRGLTVGNVGSGIGISGTSFGTLTVSEATITTNGQALSLDTGALSGSFASITSTGGTNNIRLDTVTGSFGLGSGALSGASGPALLIGDGGTTAGAGGTVALTYSGTINAGTNQRAVDIQDRAASAGAITLSGNITGSATQSTIFLDDNVTGTFTFSGAVTTANTSATAISLTDNGTSTINFTGLLTITTSGGTGLLATGGGNVTVQNASSSIDSDGQAINLNGVSVPAAGITFATTTSSGGASNVDLTSVGDTGAINLGGGSLTGATGTAFNVNGGTHNITYSGTITKTSAGRLVDFENYDDPGAGTSTATLSGNLSCSGSCTGIEAQNGTGSITFSGGTKTLNTGAGTAVNLVGNTGGTIDFTGGGLDIDTTTGTGFNATGGGTVTVQGSNNSINTTSTAAAALNVVSTNIGADDLTFQSISSNGGTNGIVLNNTGTTAGTHGGLTVTGNSAGICGGSVSAGPPAAAATATAPNAADCTGGVIQNTTGPGIILNTTRDVSLTRIRVAGADDDGIQGTNVTNFTLASSLVEDNGNADNENGLDFGDSSSLTPNGLRGTGSITNSTVENSSYSNVSIRNIDGVALTSFTITGSQFRNAPGNGAANDNVFFEVLGSASITTSVSGSFFASTEGDHFQSAASNSGNLNVTLTNNTFTGGHSTPLGQGITINAATGVAFGGYTGRIDYDVNGNNMQGTIANAIHAILGTSGATAVFDGFIRNNVVGVSGVALSCSTQGNGVAVEARGNGTHNSSVTGNTIRRCFDRGILSEAGDGDSVLHLTVQSNIIDQQVDDPVNTREAIQTNHGITSTNVFGNEDDPEVCLQIGGAGALANTFSHGGGAPDDFRLRKRFGATVRLPGYAGGTGQDAASLDAVVAFIRGQNTGSAGEPGSASASGGGGGYTGGAACTLPTP